MRAILTLLAAAVLAIAGCAPAEPPPQYLPAPLPPPPPLYNPPLPGPRAGPSMRYGKRHTAPRCTIRTHTTTNKAGVKRTARYRVCLK